MPELGKATYLLELNTKAFDAGLAAAETRAEQATQAIADSLGISERSVAALGPAAEKSGKEMGGALEGAATKANVASDEIVGANEKIQTSSLLTNKSVKKSESTWTSFSTKIKEKGKIGGGMGSLLGLGAAYEIVKGGTTWLKDANEGFAQLHNAIKVTGDVSGVTSRHAAELAKHWEEVTGAETGATLKTEALELSFKNIRNVGKGQAAIFDRTLAAVQDISARTGRNVSSVMIQLGKAIQDPTKYLGLLGRAGITFSKAQQDMVKHIAATKGTLAAQEYVLTQVEARYKGSAAAAGKTFTGQLRIAKAQMDQNSAQILHAFIPSFLELVRVLKVVSVFMAQHRTLLKDLVIAYVAWRGILFGASLMIRTVEAAQKIGAAVGWIYNKMLRGTAASAGEAGAAEEGLAAKTTLTGDAMETTTGKAGLLRRGIAGKAGLYGGALLLGFTIGELALKKFPGLDKAMEKTGREAYKVAHMIGSAFGSAMHFIDKLGNKLGIGGGKMALTWDSYNKLPEWAKKQIEATNSPAFVRMLTAHARAVRARQGVGFGEHTTGQGGGSGPDRMVKAPPKLGTGAKAKFAIPTELQDQLLQAQATGNIASIDAAAKAEDAYIRDQIKKHDLHGKLLTVALGKLRTVDSLIRTEAKKVADARKKTQLGGVDALLGAGYTRDQNAVLKAKTTKSAKDDLAALTTEEMYLKTLLKQHDLNARQKRAAISALDRVDSAISSIQKKAATLRKQQMSAKAQKLNDLLSIAESKAELDDSKANSSKVLSIQMQLRKEELKVYTKQEDVLKQRLKDKTLTLHQQAAIYKQLVEIDRKRVEAAKKVNQESTATQKEIQAAMELRGTFFGDFASNVFHKSGSGLQVGGSKSVSLEQHNHYNEIPKDRFHAARTASRAVLAAMG